MNGHVMMGAGLMTLMLALGGLGGLGLAVRLSGRRLTAYEKGIVLGVWGPLFTATVGLALAQLGWFSWRHLMGLAVAWGVLGVWGLRADRERVEEPACGSPAEGGRFFWTGWLAVLLAAGVLMVPGNRYLGGWDTGVYVGTAMQVARSGALEIRDPLLAELPEGERAAFMHETQAPRRAWHAGFLIKDARQGTLVPEFFHLYPAWLAGWAALFGLEGVWAGHALIALWALGMVMLAGAGLFGRRAGLLAGVALAACMSQAYAMRITSAEMITQFFLFAGIWAADRALRTGSGVGGLVWTAAAAWGAAVLAHGTAMLPVAAGLTFLFAQAVAGRSDGARWRFFLAVAGVTGLAVGWNGMGSRAVSQVLAGLLSTYPGWWLGAAGLGAVVVAAGLWRAFAGRRERPAREWPGWLERGLPVVVCVALLLLGGVLRPRLFPGDEALNVYFFMMLTGWAGTGLAVSFFGLHRFRDWTNGQRIFVLMGFATTLVLLISKMAKPFYLWGSRRWVELAVPFVLVLAAATLVRLAAWGGGRRRVVRAVVLAGIVVGAGCWLGGMAVRTARVYWTQEYAGLPGMMTAVAESVRDADRVLCDHWDAATALRYVHGIPAWGLTRQTLSCGPADAQRVASRMREWVRAGERVYWVGGWFADPVLCLTEAGRFETADVMLEQRKDRLPQRTLPAGKRLVVYRVGLAGGTPVREVDFGYSAMGLVAGFSGFRSGEDGQGRRFGYRRIRPRGQFYVPAIPGPWRIRLANENPRRPTVPVSLFADGVRLAEWQVGAAWAEYAFELPPGSNRTVLLELASPLFKQGKIQVGVSVDRVSAGVADSSTGKAGMITEPAPPSSEP